MKIVYCVWVNWFGENQFFFDFNGNLLCWWSCHDAIYRHEYMNPLLKTLGICVEHANQTDPRFMTTIQKTLRDMGANDEDFID